MHTNRSDDSFGSKSNRAFQKDTDLEILKIMKPFVEDLKAGRPLPPLMGIIGEERSMINEFRSEFRKLQDLQRVPEASMVSSGKDIIQMMASSGNSYLRLEAEDFIFKYWRYLWRSPRAVADEVLAGLEATCDTPNRENLYRLLQKIHRDASTTSGEAEVFDIDGLIPQVTKDIESANQCAPFDASGLPHFIIASLPQGSEHIVCAYALECLVLRMENDHQISWESLNLPRVSPHSMESILKVLRHRNAFPDASPEEIIENRRILSVVERLANFKASPEN